MGVTSKIIILVAGVEIRILAENGYTSTIKALFE